MLLTCWHPDKRKERTWHSAGNLAVCIVGLSITVGTLNVLARTLASVLHALEWALGPTRIQEGLCNGRGEPNYACVSSLTKAYAVADIYVYRFSSIVI